MDRSGATDVASLHVGRMREWASCRAQCCRASCTAGATSVLTVFDDELRQDALLYAPLGAVYHRHEDHVFISGNLPLGRVLAVRRRPDQTACRSYSVLAKMFLFMHYGDRDGGAMDRCAELVRRRWIKADTSVLVHRELSPLEYCAIHTGNHHAPYGGHQIVRRGA
jgi:hypothetical protein